MTAPRCLVVGSYPPVPGPAAAATVAAVRRAWAAGRDVVVVSPRPSAAPFVLRATGARGIAREVARLGRRHDCDRVVLCLEPGWPLRGSAERAARSLAAALSSFQHAEVVVTGTASEVGVTGVTGTDWHHLAPLWGAAESLTAGSEEVGALLRAAGAPSVNVRDPYERARAHRPCPPSLPLGNVSPIEHGELLLRVRARRLLGSLARKGLGRRAPSVRAFLRHPLRWAHRAVRSGGGRRAAGAGPGRPGRRGTMH